MQKAACLKAAFFVFLNVFEYYKKKKTSCYDINIFMQIARLKKSPAFYKKKAGEGVSNNFTK